MKSRTLAAVFYRDFSQTAHFGRLLLCKEGGTVSVAKLSEKQKRFVQEYLVDLNATQAAIRAGYSEKSAARIAVELLNKTHVSAELQRAMKNRQKRVEITQDMVLAELAAVAFANGTDFATITHGGSVCLTPTSELPEEKKKAVASIKEGQYGTEVKLHDKVRALELLEKLLAICPIGGTVLDPFMGSGSMGVACANVGRKFIGIELSPEYYSTAERRISEAEMQAQKM